MLRKEASEPSVLVDEYVVSVHDVGSDAVTVSHKFHQSPREIELIGIEPTDPPPRGPSKGPVECIGLSAIGFGLPLKLGMPPEHLDRLVAGPTVLNDVFNRELLLAVHAHDAVLDEATIVEGRSQHAHIDHSASTFGVGAADMLAVLMIEAVR
jgi:hypothetical protein